MANQLGEIKARKKHSEKDLGFLRIGSLNVRVKKTTEAFSNFLGVGSSTIPNGSSHRPLHARQSAPASIDNFDKLHKNWGSADNIPPSGDGNAMPPPKYSSVKKRRAKRAAEYRTGHHSVPTTPNQERSKIHSLLEHPQTESDSDTAGFDSNWK